jgi:hypothetical protein
MNSWDRQISLGWGSVTPAFAGANFSYLRQFTRVSPVASTIPTTNGDLNPYGVAVVHDSIGLLHRGDVLVSNFNDSDNAQGTGSTIVEISPSGTQQVFATVSGPPGTVGLTTALAILPHGIVVVGSLLTVNAGDGFIVETTPFGQVVNAQLLDNTVQSSPLPPNPGFGALFGLAIAPHHAGVYFVDDNENALNLLGRP